MAMTAAEVRRAFLEFYAARQHEHVPSAPLVPHDDPTLLFTSAGMVQFKKLYSGAVPLPYRRAMSIQKCLRVNDIADVGRSPRHDTFFEMLGHFSFGDYFKKEAITWNWELFTRICEIDPERLTASVYEQDDEAYQIWREVIGLPQGRIVRLGPEHNFWGPAGGSGACGPCSELYYDLGPEVDPAHPEAQPGDESDRFVEVGNFVFPQFDRQSDGRDLPLKNRGIDTGIGLERLVMVVQGKTSIFHTDLFWPIIARATEICGHPYAGNEIALRIIADHVRALTFALAEGVFPASDGRGYVVRRLIRRAAVQGFHLGLREPFLHRLVAPVVEIMGTPYPEVAQASERTELAVRNEEERFGATLQQAIAKLEDLLNEVVRSGAPSVPGEAAFVLYDTYGLPLEVITDMAVGRGLTVDEEGFQHWMERQKERSRATATFGQRGADLAWHTVHAGADSEFCGYTESRTRSRVMRYAALPDMDRTLVVLDRTPFYAESGGQVGDTGTLRSGEIKLPVVGTLREGTEIRHIVPGEPGVRERLGTAGAFWEAVVDEDRRASIRRHHTATHLLQAALRRVLGSHVAQAGSLVAPDRLRFDFAHSAALTHAEREAVERIANEEIVRNTPVQIHFSTYAEAVGAGVTALFGEKYDAGRVRRVRIGGVSEELCGGTHVSATGEIGSLIILEESAVAAGVRRIEAVCGLAALHELQRIRAGVSQVRRLLGTTLEDAPTKVEHLQEEIARLKKDLGRVRRGEGVADLDRLLAGAETVGSSRYVVGEVCADSVAALREMGDRVRQRLGSGAALLCAEVGEKTTFLAVVSDDVIAAGRVQADVLVRAVAALTGGSGGGRAHMALAGAGDRAQVPAALAEGRRILREALAPV